MMKTLILSVLSLRLVLTAAAQPVGTNPEPETGHEHPMSHEAMGQEMRGMLGGYPMTRDASGTSWQPESTPHEGIMRMHEGDEWMSMVHGFALGAYDNQGGKRGDTEAFSASMLMGMAQRNLGQSMLTLRAMVSLDPAMGKRGYPLLLQTGETADGKTPLIDRQHPHDLFMELSATYSRSVGERSSVFAYFGLPGEPALGPPAFMHRFSGIDDPQAPISHHWLDSTHITYGVATLGYVWKDWKIEGSAFQGREPDQDRWNIEKPKLDSYSGRFSFNPTKDWAIQASYGWLVSSEQLEPDVDLGRLTASASRNWKAGGGSAQTTFAFGRNSAHGRKLDAFLLETAVKPGEHTLFGRVERVEKNELFDSGPLLGEIFTVHRVSLGYIYDFAAWKRTRLGIGSAGSLHLVPSSLRTSYGRMPASLLLFVRAKLG